MDPPPSRPNPSHYCSIQPGEMIEGRYQVLRAREVVLDVVDLERGVVTGRRIPVIPSPPLPPVEESRRYRITGIEGGMEEGATTTVALEEADNKNLGDLVGRRTFDLKDAEKIKVIRDALAEKDKDVFCTVFKICGIEALWDIKWLPKDPPILRLPQEMIEMICAHLSRKDLCALRLVSPNFARTLPLYKIWSVHDLLLGGGAGGTAKLKTKKKPLSNPKEIERTIFRQWNSENADEADNNPAPRPQPPWLSLDSSNALWMKDTEEFRVSFSSDFEDPPLPLLETISGNCNKLKRISMNMNYIKGRDEVKTLEPEPLPISQAQWQKITNLCSSATLRNQSTLKSFSFSIVNAQAQVQFDCASILSHCGYLEELELSLTRAGKLLNLESLWNLKDNLRVLNLLDMENPLSKEQLVWIGRNFRNLETLKVLVFHDCEGEGDRELDMRTIRAVLDRDIGGLPKLRSLEISYPYCNNQEREVDEEDEDAEYHDVSCTATAGKLYEHSSVMNNWGCDGVTAFDNRGGLEVVRFTWNETNDDDYSTDYSDSD